MCDGNDQQHVILKEAHNGQSSNAEVNAFDGSSRQLVNAIPDQNIIVYEHLAENLHNILYSRPQQEFEEEEVKRVARVVLKGLATRHEKNMAHIGML